MTDVNTTYTTLTDAINICLSCIGETPVATPNNPSTNVVLSKKIIQEVSRDVQSKGWWFNTSGSSISILPISSHSDNDGNATFHSDIPEEARRYISIRAARVLQSRFVGSEELQKFSFQEEQVSLAILTQAHVRNGGNATSFNSFPSELKQLGIEEVMFLQQSAEEKLLSLRLKTELKQAEKLSSEKDLVDAQKSQVQTETVLRSQQALTELEETSKRASEKALIDAQELKTDEETKLIAAQELKTDEETKLIAAQELKTDEETKLITAQAADVAADTTLKGKQGALVDAQELKTDEETKLISAQELKTDEETKLIAAQELKTDEETKLIAAQELKTDEETKLIAAQELKTDEETKLIAAQELKTDEETKLIAAQELKTDEETKLIAAQELKTDEETKLIAAQELKTDEETKLIAAQELKTDEETKLIAAQELKTDEETKLIASQELKTDAEKLQVDAQTSLLESQKTELDAKTAIDVAAEKAFYDGVVAGTQDTYRDYAAEMRMMGIQESTFQQTPAYKKVELLKDAQKLRATAGSSVLADGELGVVNKILRLIGEPTTTSVSSNALNMATLQLMRDVDRELQGRGWWFNTEKDVEITPVNGTIVLDGTMLSAEANDYDTRLDVNGDGAFILYDLNKKSSTSWTSPVKVTAIYKRSLPVVPDKYEEYLVVRTAILLTEMYPQSGIDIQRLPKMEQELRAYFKDRENDEANYSIFDNYDAAARIGINRNYSLI